MNTKLIEFICFSIIEEVKAIGEYNYRAEACDNEEAKNLFKEISMDEIEHLKELISLLSNTSPIMQKIID